jgi:putative toxin-antitoxin system antitoxin component (TIGR02293 family)
MTTLAAIAGVLGGARTVGARPRSAADWQALIEAGVPVGSAEALKRAMALPDSQLAALLGISEKTLSRGRAGRGRLDPVASDRLFRVARIGALAIEVLEDEARAVSWLKRPQVGLGGRTPLSLLTTDAGRDQVEKLLLRIEHGVYS